MLLLTVLRRRLQPVRETRERQVALWKDFILEYCRAHRVRARVSGCSRIKAVLTHARLPRRRQLFAVNVEEDTPLFCNTAINRACCHAAGSAVQRRSDS